MSGYSRVSSVAAYQSAAAHGGVAAADPHGLIVMLMDGALERIRAARGCIDRGDTAEKARLLHRCVSIIAELRGSLDMNAGGQISGNLSELYDYMNRRLLVASSENLSEPLEEVSALLNEIRAAWVAIPAGIRHR
ncbi:flagellar protein FliS [Steroidobacter denitrificans]|uniref:Flagellar secretion chaperone FliS n=1 Tax=Steroidobacter denitrificans TaxID=465721 RepID=A0A127FAK9_STEDE|nr:flagellar export chaperone FliS [Steroidobacter denitrificans]AMN46589.1 flagellar protein FliS [Steroidobacter denitrificans]